MDHIQNRKENVKPKWKRRSSILKDNVESEKIIVKSDVCSSKRRVSFADTTSIKEFLVTRDANTEWNHTYEEPMPFESSTSSMEMTHINSQTSLFHIQPVTATDASMKGKLISPSTNSLEGPGEGIEGISTFLSGLLGMGSTESEASETVRDETSAMEFTCGVNKFMANSKTAVGCEDSQSKKSTSMNISMDLTLKEDKREDCSINCEDEDTSSCLLNKSLFAHLKDVNTMNDVPLDAASEEQSRDDDLYSNNLQREMDVTNCVTKSNIFKASLHYSENREQNNDSFSDMEVTKAVGSAVDPVLTSLANLDNTESEAISRDSDQPSSPINNGSVTIYGMEMTVPVISKRILNSDANIASTYDMNGKCADMNMEMTCAVPFMSNKIGTDLDVSELSTPSKVVSQGLESCDLPMNTLVDGLDNSLINDLADPGKILGLFTSQITNKEKFVNMSLFCNNPQAVNNSSEIPDFKLNIFENRSFPEKRICERPASFMEGDKEDSLFCSEKDKNKTSNEIETREVVIPDVEADEPIMEFTCAVTNILSNSENNFVDDNPQKLISTQHNLSNSGSNFEDFNMQLTQPNVNGSKANLLTSLKLSTNSSTEMEEIPSYQNIQTTEEFTEKSCSDSEQHIGRNINPDAELGEIEMEETCAVSDLISSSNKVDIGSVESADSELDSSLEHFETKNQFDINDKAKLYKVKGLTLADQNVTNKIEESIINEEIILQNKNVVEVNVESESSTEVFDNLGTLNAEDQFRGEGENISVDVEGTSKNETGKGIEEDIDASESKGLECHKGQSEDLHTSNLFNEASKTNLEVKMNETLVKQKEVDAQNIMLENLEETMEDIEIYKEETMEDIKINKKETMEDIEINKEETMEDIEINKDVIVREDIEINIKETMENIEINKEETMEDIEINKDVILRENCDESKTVEISGDEPVSHLINESAILSKDEKQYNPTLNEVSKSDGLELVCNKQDTKPNGSDIVKGSDYVDDKIVESTCESKVIDDNLISMEPCNDTEEVLDDIDLDLVEDDMNFSETNSSNKSLEATNSNNGSPSPKDNSVLNNFSFNDSKIIQASSEVNNSVSNIVKNSPPSRKHKLGNTNAAPEVEEKKIRLNDELVDGNISIQNIQCDQSSKNENEGPCLVNTTKSNNTILETSTKMKSLCSKNMECDLCQRYLRSKSISSFEIEKLNEYTLHLKLVLSPFKLVLNLISEDHHQIIRETDWKPQLDELKTPEAKLAVKMYESCLNHHIEKLVGCNLCNAATLLADVIDSYESMMSFLKEIYIIKSTFVSSCLEDGLNVTVTNAKAHLMIDLSIKVKENVSNWICRPTILIEPDIKIGNIRKSTIEEAIAAVDGKYKLLNKVKAVDFIASNMAR